MLIRTPPAWGIDRIRDAFGTIGSAPPDDACIHGRSGVAAPTVRRIGLADLRTALSRGFDDFAANRSDVIFLCVIYPVAGLFFAGLAAGSGLLQMLFPLASGFAVIGPFAAIGLYEMSRRREAGRSAGWADAFAVLRAPAIGHIVLLGMMLLLILVLWLIVAALIYDVTLGPAPPASFAAFANALFGTGAGWALIAVGIAVGAVFASVAFIIAVVSFPLLIDRDVGLETAVRTSVRVVAVNPGPMLAWAAIVTAGLVVGSLPLLVGLAVVLPVLGHATWHLYRAVIVV